MPEPQQPTPDPYNYTIFEGKEDFIQFRTILQIGSPAPDFTATLLETGQPVHLSDYWQDRDLLIEFGSLTWPYCSLAAPALEPMAREYTSKGFNFIFVYVREAHPGENYGAHHSMQQKLAHAQAFRQLRNIQRPILVDDLSGTGHKLYGELPNMTYLIGRGGRVLFRSDWTDPPTIQLFLNYLLNIRERRRQGERLTAFYAEFAGFRQNDRTQFMEGLKLAGPQAVEDFTRMIQHWTQHGDPGRIDV